jgi:hypothetical protein
LELSLFLSKPLKTVALLLNKPLLGQKGGILIRFGYSERPWVTIFNDE